MTGSGKFCLQNGSVISYVNIYTNHNNLLYSRAQIIWRSFSGFFKIYITVFYTTYFSQCTAYKMYAGAIRFFV